MMEASRISLAYVESEDRIRLDCGDGKGRLTLLLTRRITRRLVKGLADLLASSSLAVTRTPADLRREVIVLEHFSAVMAPSPQPAAAGGGEAADPADPADLGQGLVDNVEVQIHPTSFRLVFHAGAGPVASLWPSRAELHKILAALAREARRGDWNIGEEAGWISDAESVVLSPSGRSAS
jgi:hypothetical protein